jgi:hypothetical protein
MPSEDAALVGSTIKCDQSSLSSDEADNTASVDSSDDDDDSDDDEDSATVNSWEDSDEESVFSNRASQVDVASLKGKPLVFKLLVRMFPEGWEPVQHIF